MKTLMKRLIAGGTLAVLAGSLDACAPVMVASRPRPVIVDPVPVAVAPAPVVTPVVIPVVPVWAPPYAYVNQVHYYYFPDYMVYYDVFASTYCYYNGFSWLHVAVLPSLPLYYGFNPYNSYIVVLNRSCYNPWIRHNYYTNLYPTGYYQTTYAPRTSLGSNTVLRAFDENENRPLFVDKRTNKEVAVKYDVKQGPRTAISSNTERKSSLSAKQDVRQETGKNSAIRSSEHAATFRDVNAGNDAKQKTRNMPSETVAGPADRRTESQNVRTDSRKSTRENKANATDQNRDRNTSLSRTENATRQEKNVRAAKSQEPVRANSSSEKKAAKADSRSTERIRANDSKVASEDFRMERKSEADINSNEKVRKTR